MTPRLPVKTCSRMRMPPNDPAAMRDRQTGSAILGGKGHSGRDVCWGSTANPTDAHRIEADARRQVAGQHRAASQALRDAEATACEGLAADERDMSPFDNTDDIASVAPLTERVPVCPLIPPGVSASATSTGKGLAVAMRSADPETAKELLRRARALIAPTPPVIVKRVVATVQLARP